MRQQWIATMEKETARSINIQEAQCIQKEIMIANKIQSHFGA